MKPIKIKYRKNGTLLDSAQIIQSLKQGQRKVPSKEAGLFSLLGRTLRTFFRPSYEFVRWLLFGQI